MLITGKRWRGMVFWMISALLLVEGSKASNGNTVLILKDSLKQTGIRKERLHIFEDKENRYTIEQVSTIGFRDSFITILDETPFNRNKNATYWLKFQIVNKSSPNNKWLIEMFDPNINLLCMYVPGTNGFTEQCMGNSFNFSQRLFGHKNFEFDLNVAPDEIKTFYLKINSKNNNILIPQVRSYNRFISYALSEYYYLGLFYGILLIMAVYNLLLFITIRRLSYLLYVGYVLSVGVYSMCQTGLAFQYLWPETPALNQSGSYVALYFTMLFFVLFSSVFLDIKNKLPLLYKILNVVLLLRTLVLVLGLLWFEKILTFLSFDLFPLVIIYLSGILIFKKGIKISIYFLLANTFLLFAFTVTILEQFGIVGSNIFTVYSLNIGIVLDILLLSISLADGMRKEIHQRVLAQTNLLNEIREKELLGQKVNKELEEKVANRTFELNEANEKLKQQAEAITHINLKLDLLNRDLQKNIVQTTRQGIMKTHVDFEEFVQIYPDELSCYRFLEDLKGSKKFQCKKCHAGTFGKGKEVFDRRCTRCGYNDSITSNTIFHKLKFPIVKAFYIIYLVSKRSNITAQELSDMVDLRKETCSLFKKKVLERLKKVSKKDLESWDVLILNEPQLTEVP